MTQQTFNKQVKTFIRICIILYTILGITIITFPFDYLQERKKDQITKINQDNYLTIVNMKVI